MGQDVKLNINRDMLEAFASYTNSCEANVTEAGAIFNQSAEKLLQDGLFKGQSAEVVAEAVRDMKNLVELSQKRISAANTAAANMCSAFRDVTDKTKRPLEEARNAFRNTKAKAANPNA